MCFKGPPVDLDFWVLQGDFVLDALHASLSQIVCEDHPIVRLFLVLFEVLLLRYQDILPVAFLLDVHGVADFGEGGAVDGQVGPNRHALVEHDLGAPGSQSDYVPS